MEGLRPQRAPLPNPPRQNEQLAVIRAVIRNYLDFGLGFPPLRSGGGGEERRGHCNQTAAAHRRFRDRRGYPLSQLAAVLASREGISQAARIPQERPSATACLNLAQVDDLQSWQSWS